MARATLVTAHPDEPALDLFARLQATAGSRALVFDSGRLAGIVSPTDVARTLEIELLRHADLVAKPLTSWRWRPVRVCVGQEPSPHGHVVDLVILHVGAWMARRIGYTGRPVPFNIPWTPSTTR